MELDAGQWVVIGICVILLFGYISGYYNNRGRAERIYRWLRDGLSRWGETTPGDRLPGMVTGGSLTVSQASAPFRRIEAVFILEPRENLLFWLFYHLGGRRDELVLKIYLRSDPDQEIEAAYNDDKDFRRQLAAADKKPFTTVSGPGKLQFAWREKKSAEAIEKAQGFLEKYTPALLRLSLRRKQPHLFVRIHLASLLANPAQDFFAALQQLVAS